MAPGQAEDGLDLPISGVRFCRPFSPASPRLNDFVLLLPVLVFSVVAHEYAHGYAAYHQGDKTAYMLGRLTLNPLPHIDPWMSLAFPLLLWLGSHGQFTFGAAKPVPVVPRNYRNYRRGDIIVSAAGVVTNFALSLVCTGLFALLGMVGQLLPDAVPFLAIGQRMMLLGVTLNLVLCFFNLIPVPPLDGSHLFYYLLPPALGDRYRAMGRFGFLIVLGLVWLVPSAINFLLAPAWWLGGVLLGAVHGYALAVT